MNGKIAVLFFAVAMLLQLSHCIPTHRYARETPDWTSKIKEYMNKIPGYGSSTSQTAPSPATQPETQPETTSYQPSATAASELHPLIATKEGSSSVPSIGSYMPAGMPSMPNMPNMPSMPNMQSYYPSTMPQSMNPGNYMNSIPGGSTNAAGSAGSASAPEASIAAKEGSSSVPSFGSYMPAGMPNMPNMPSMPNMQSYYPSSMPQSMNPGNYMNSIPGGSTNAAGSAGSASAPEASIAAKEGSSSVPSFGSYMPAGMPNMPNMPSMPNMQSYYPSSMPQSMNPGNYMNSIPGGSTNAAGSAGSASAPEASIAAKEGSSSVPSIGSYMPAGMPNMPNMPSMPNMQSYYPSSMPQSMNPGNYMNSIPGGSSNAAGTTGSASAPGSV